jgi:CelD/BcsL family acetyltransferase involved in cellulose biosynthesis
VQLFEHAAADAVVNYRNELDRISQATGSVFLTSAWLEAWTGAFAPGARMVVARNGDRLLAAACVRPLRPYGLGSASNLETDDWTVAGDDDGARRAVWRHLADMAHGRLQLVAVPDTREHAGMAREVLSSAGYKVAHRESVANPRVELPPSWDELISSVGRNTRSLFRRRARALAEVGAVNLRTSTADRLEADLKTFYRLEASGWKGRAGTAIVARPDARRLYDRFARSLAGEGRLRLQLLEVDGEAVAADYSCTFAGGVFMLKTAFDESWSRFSPGLVLRAEALRSAIEDGLQFYDFLGPADDYKMRWGAVAHPHVTISAFRGPLAPVAHTWHARLRPELKACRTAAQAGMAKLDTRKRLQSLPWLEVFHRSSAGRRRTPR